jgi:ribosomal protein S19
MSRSKWKAPVAHSTLLKSSVIFPSDVSSSLSISNGKTNITFKVSQPMVGHRVGEFYLAQKFVVSKSKKNTNVRGKR